MITYTIPNPLPAWYINLWEPWREKGGIPSQKPAGIPYAVSLRYPWVWSAYRLRHTPPKPIDYGILAKSGWYVRSPDSGSPSEKIPEVKRVGFSHLMLNARDYRGRAWDDWRILAARAGLPVVPVGRVYDGPNSLSRSTDPAIIALDTVHYLLDTAYEWGSPGVAFNIENEAETVMPPARLYGITTEYRGSMAIITDFRGFISVNKYYGPDYSVFADRAVGIVETNTGNGAVLDVAGCLLRLHQMGFKCVSAMPDTRMPPSAYALSGVTRVPYVLDIVDTDHIKDWL